MSKGAHQYYITSSQLRRLVTIARRRLSSIAHPAGGLDTTLCTIQRKHILPALNAPQRRLHVHPHRVPLGAALRQVLQHLPAHSRYAAVACAAGAMA